MGKLCKARVWENGDMDSCNSAVYIGDYCKEHIDREMSFLVGRMLTLSKEMESVRKALKELGIGDDEIAVFVVMDQ